MITYPPMKLLPTDDLYWPLELLRGEIDICPEVAEAINNFLTTLKIRVSLFEGSPPQLYLWSEEEAGGIHWTDDMIGPTATLLDSLLEEAKQDFDGYGYDTLADAREAYAVMLESVAAQLRAAP